MTSEHQIMLVTNAGQMIRLPVEGIRFTGRSAQGVTLFRVAEGEQIVSVAWLKQEAETVEEDEGTSPEGEVVDVDAGESGEVGEQ